MTLERIPEPEVMDTPEEAQDYNAMDHSEVNRLFVDDFLATGFRGTDILDLGTGTALIPVELCQRRQECRVMAVDASVNMLELAKFNLDKAGLSHRVQLQKVDAKKMAFADAMFEAVISNSIIHHIPQPVVCLRDAVRVTQPGGRLFFRDLLRPDDQSQLDHLVQTWAGDESSHARQMFADSLHAALSLDEIRELVRSLGFAAETVQPTSDRHWTWSAIQPGGD